MTLRYLRNGAIAIVIAGGLPVGLAYAQQRDGGLLPLGQDGIVTVAGCLMRGDQISGAAGQKFVLANLHTGIDSVAEETCTADPNATAVRLDQPGTNRLADAMLGRWVEIQGRLEKEESTSGRHLRELDVASARLLPVVIPVRAAAPAPAPEPPAFQAAAPEVIVFEPAPVATSGQLPKTASPVPLMGLLGLFACAGGFVLRSFRKQLG
jgi:hypothetical protein